MLNFPNEIISRTKDLIDERIDSKNIINLSVIRPSFLIWVKLMLAGGELFGRDRLKI